MCAPVTGLDRLETLTTAPVTSPVPTLTARLAVPVPAVVTPGAAVSVVLNVTVPVDPAGTVIFVLNSPPGLVCV